MEIVKRNSDYALRGLAYMAEFPKGQPLLLSSIARKTRTSEEFLRKIFQRLTQKGILASQPGPKGGFFLTKNPSEISLLEIMEILQGPFSLNKHATKRRLCYRARHCPIKTKLDKMEKKIVSLFKKLTIKELTAA